jgi:glycosyltransferase involved in cell wall biosynthesis
VTATEPANRNRPRRIAYVSFSTGEFDSRTERMARSVLETGADVVAYARWEPGLPLQEDRDGYRLVRVPVDTMLAVPGLAGRARRGLARQVAASAAPASPDVRSLARPRPGARAGDPRAVGALAARPSARGLTGRVRRVVAGTPLFRPLRAVRDLARLPRRWLLLPASLRAFAVALDDVAQPADLWHGMSIQALPAVVRRKKRSGGVAIYDSRDIYMHARELARVGGIRRRIFETAERRWAHAVDAVLTVNDQYAAILERQLRVPRPPVVMNCPNRWTPPEPRPDRIRDHLGLPATTDIVLYQGGLFSERGIEQSMDAILEVPGAVLVLLGYGRLEGALRELVEQEPYRGRVYLLDAVPPGELLSWTASADVMVMAIQPSSLNHQHTTPNKLFEAMAAGVPVVASDLPGMATIVQATGCGVLCDPTDPASIAAAIRTLLGASRDERANRRARCLAAAHDTYNWESQVGTLLALYDRLLAGAPRRR